MDAAPHPHAPRPATFEIGGQCLEVNATGFAEAIAQAHASTRRPRCLCQPGGVEMYVARLGGGYVIKRMPDTGSRHAAGCPSFAPSAELTGLAPLLGTAIREDPITGRTTLRLDFPLSKRPGRSTASSGEAATTSVRSSGIKLSMRGLLHYLWEQADLTRWHPGFEGKRTWGTVRKLLLDAAEPLFAGNTSLAARLYAPEPFSLQDQDEIRARRSARWSRATDRTGQDQELSLLIAELKEIMPARHGFKAVIKHLPDVAFAVGAPLYKAIGRRFTQELGLWSWSVDVRMMLIATFELGRIGVPVMSAVCLMPVTQHWLPVATVAELQLVERLVRQGRAFRKVLGYDPRCIDKTASVVLIDRGDPAPIYLVNFSDSCV